MFSNPSRLLVIAVGTVVAAAIVLLITGTRGMARKPCVRDAAYYSTGAVVLDSTGRYPRRLRCEDGRWSEVAVK